MLVISVSYGNTEYAKKFSSYEPTFDGLRSEEIISHQLSTRWSVLRIGDHLGQVLQDTTTWRIWEPVIERMEVVAFTAAYVNKQDVVRVSSDPVEDGAMHIKPIHPVRGQALL